MEITLKIKLGEVHHRADRPQDTEPAAQRLAEQIMSTHFVPVPGAAYAVTSVEVVPRDWNTADLPYPTANGWRERTAAAP